MRGTYEDVERFGLGEAATRVTSLLDGTMTVTDLIARFRSPEARANFLRILHLLAQTELAAPSS
jgi:hypothetical protein